MILFIYLYLGIENLEEEQKIYYINFETTSRDKYYKDNYTKQAEYSFDSTGLLIQSVNKLDENLNLFKIWVMKLLIINLKL